MSHTPIHVRVTVTAIPASVETLTESIGSSCLSTRTYKLKDSVTEFTKIWAKMALKDV